MMSPLMTSNARSGLITQRISISLLECSFSTEDMVVLFNSSPFDSDILFIHGQINIRFIR